MAKLKVTNLFLTVVYIQITMYEHYILKVAPEVGRTRIPME